MSIASYAQELKLALHQYPNFPSEGILFEDFLPIFRNPGLFQKLIDAFKLHLEEAFPEVKIDYIVGLESRGFLFGPTLALALGVGFVPVRKAGKLPGECFKATIAPLNKNIYTPSQKIVIFLHICHILVSFHFAL